jgi:hypothetical protein
VQHSHWRFTHITNTHIPCESAPSFQTHHRQLYCNHQSYTATTGGTFRSPPAQHSHRQFMHKHIPCQYILDIHPLIMHGKSYCYQYNLCQHTTATAGNAATGTGAAQPPPATCTYLFKQRLHSLHPCLQHFSDSHHCNASTSGAMQPPPELRSHCQCYAVTTGVAQPPPVIPILSFLLPLRHFQHTTNSSHCNPTTSRAAQPLVISPLPFPLPPQMFPTHLTGHIPNRDLN